VDLQSAAKANRYPIPTKQTKLIYSKEEITMTQKPIVLLVMIALLWPGFAAAVTEKDFEVNAAQDLINLCAVSPDDPLYLQAINFCHGYFEGAYQYYEAMTSGPKGIKFVCVPDPLPSRNEAINKFLEWAESNPQHMDGRPVEAQFRFLMETWPYKP
jgi:hypothetical protein